MALKNIDNYNIVGKAASPQEARTLPQFTDPECMRFAGATAFMHVEGAAIDYQLPDAREQFSGLDELVGHRAYLEVGGATAEHPVDLR